MLEGKHIVLGVTGSIAAYKIASLASMLKKEESGRHRDYDEKRHEFYQSHYL